MPLVSVIVPVYGVEAYLPKCVDSILSQSFSDFELILVDDGSPDNCGAICDEYAARDSRVRVIHKENGGVTVARNVALDIAAGKYVTFCDSDDSWEAQLLEIAVKPLLDEGADCVLFGLNVCTDEGISRTRSYEAAQYEFHTPQDTVNYLIHVQLTAKHGWSLCTHLFSKEIIDQFQIRGCTTCNNFAEDMGFVCRYMLHSKKIVSISDCLYNYYMRGSSMMHRSEEIARLNDVNEVSFYVGQDFYRTFPSKDIRKHFPIMHLLMVNGQVSKLRELSKHEQFPSEVSKLDKLQWWKQNTNQLRHSYSILKKHFGAHSARRTVLYSSYLKHGNWKLYNLKSAIYYKFYNAFKK